MGETNVTVQHRTRKTRTKTAAELQAEQEKLKEDLRIKRRELSAAKRREKAAADREAKAAEERLLLEIGRKYDGLKAEHDAIIDWLGSNGFNGQSGSVLWYPYLKGKGAPLK